LRGYNAYYNGCLVHLTFDLDRHYAINGEVDKDLDPYQLFIVTEKVELIPDGYIIDTGTELRVIRFQDAISKDNPKVVIDHWKSWVLGSEEVIDV